MSYVIYMAISRTSGNYYIGITSRSVDQRRKEHQRVSKLPTRTHRHCVALANAIRKYGAADFEWVTLGSGLSQEDAQELERRLIADLRPPYNVAAGGLSGTGFVGFKRSPETIERMRAAAKKRGVSASARAALEATRNRPVQCVETGTIYADAKQAAAAFNLSRATVYDLIYKGRVSRAAQVSFRYAVP